jgi:ATP-binding cassette subfamily B (MDR/TAP) protein 1
MVGVMVPSTSPSSSSPSSTSQSAEVEMNSIEKTPVSAGNEMTSRASLEEKPVTTSDTQTPTARLATDQKDGVTPNPYAHLPDHEAAILERQVGSPEAKYSFWHIYRYATRVDLLIIVVAGLCSCASGAAMPVMTIIFGGLQGVFQDYLVYRTRTLDEFKNEMARYVLYFVYLAIGTFFATYISTLGFIYTGEHITTNLRQQYLKSCLRQNIAFFDKVGAGEVAVKITSDADQIQDGISEKVGLLLSSLATLLTGYLIGFIISWKLTLIMSSVFVFLLLNTALWTIVIVKYAQPGTLVIVKASTLIQEIFTGVRVAIAFGSQKDVIKQYDGHLKATQGYGFRIKAAIGMMLAVSMGAMHLTYGLGFWQGSVFLARGELSLERMITALMSVMIGSFNVGSIGPYLQAFTSAVSTASRLMVVIDRKTAIDATDADHGEKPADVHGQLTLRDIRHIYPSRPEVTVLDRVSLEFEAGKVTALVGASGSGKSTIVGIIERFYDPVGGSALLDGRDISTLNVGWLRRQIGLVGQEPVLFAGSIFDNIRHGLIGSPGEHLDEAAQRDLVVAAAKDANAHDFITQLAQGYDTDVGQRGLLLSGGQKQRIAIARAIVSNPKSKPSYPI